jgi:hypothetical protein
VSQAKELLEDPELNLKVIVLVRDPRAVMLLRSSSSWCQLNPMCSNIKQVCRDLDKDVLAAFELVETYPGRIHLGSHQVVGFLYI